MVWQHARKLTRAVAASLRPLYVAVSARVAPTVLRWWGNPLLHHQRRLKPLPGQVLRRRLPAAAGGLTLLAALAWVAGQSVPGRVLGALLIGLSLGAVSAPLLAAPVVGADRVARQMLYDRQDPRRLTDLDPLEVVWGLALVVLWRLRWLIVAALALTPALMISLLRLDVADFVTWRESAQALGGATAASRVHWLLPSGGIPYFRLVIRAASAALLPWAALPLFASAGVTAALRLADLSLSPLVALLGEAVTVPLVILAWNLLTLTPALAGPFEVLRLVLIIGLMAGLCALAVWVNRLNARLLTALVPASVPNVEVEE